MALAREGENRYMKKIILILGIGVLAALILIQLVPIGRQHTNPPVVQEPN